MTNQFQHQYPNACQTQNARHNWLVSTKNVRTHATVTLVEEMLNVPSVIIDLSVYVCMDLLEIHILSAKNVSLYLVPKYFISKP